MCGKFTQKPGFANAVRIADAILEGADETVTPMRFASVIARDREGRRRTVRMRWGLVPGIDAKPHIHARAETIDSKPAFRDSFLHRRGLVLATTFNEGEEVTPTKTQQYVITPAGTVAIAVVWDRWDGTPPLLSFAMVTAAANPLIATITDRMPALIEPEHWAKWLGEESASIEELKAMLKPSAREFAMERAGKPPAAPKAQLEMF